MDAKGLVQYLGRQLDIRSKAKKKVDEQLTEVLDVFNAVNNMMATVATHESAKRFAEYHMIKLPGQYGTYGVNAEKTRLYLLRDALSNDIAFYKAAISLYNRVANGVDISEEYIDPPPGVAQQEACCVWDKDKDHPGSWTRLIGPAELKLVNRESVDGSGCPLSVEEGGHYILPTGATGGELIVKDGILHVHNGGQFYIVGLQEHDDPSVYGLCHNTDCETEGGA